MKFMVMHKHDKGTEAGEIPSGEFMQAMGAFIGGAAASGKLLDGEGLGASKSRSRVTLSSGEVSVLHGPFGGSNELPAGFVKISVGSRQEAIAIATQIGEAIGGDVEIEVGKLHEMWDLGMCEKPEGAPERYLVVHKATEASEAGQAANLEAVVGLLTSQGVVTASASLAPSSRGKRLTWRSGKHSVVDGPFTESKELIGGYAILDLASMEECLAFTHEYAKLMLSVGDTLEIDIRPV